MEHDALIYSNKHKHVLICKYASDALSRVLKDMTEHPMVQHEAAEALGSISGLIFVSLNRI